MYENFEIRDRDGIAIAERDGYGRSIKHRLIEGRECQEALTAVWAAGKGCRKGKPVEHDLPSAVNEAIRGKFIARKIAWYPARHPVRSGSGFQEAMICFVFDTDE